MARVPSALDSETRRATSRARVEAASSELVEQAGEALQALLDVLGADVEGGDQRIELHAALVDAVLGALVAVVDEFGRLDEIAAVRLELARQLAEIADDVRGDVAEVRDVRLDAVGGVAGRAVTSFIAVTNSDTRSISVFSSALMFS